MSGVAVFVLVCEQMVDTLNKCWHLLRVTLIIQQCDNKRFICDFMSISYDLQGSLIFFNICLENFLRFSAMQEVWKSVEIRQSYHEKFDAPFFMGHSVVKFNYH